jgi:hypothetical protein
LHLADNLNIHPDELIGDGNGIVGTGTPGSGKTTLLALLLEQLGWCDIPFIAFDLEGDLRSIVNLLPRGVLATADNCPTIREMYTYGLQVIFDIASWEDDTDSAAFMIAAIVNGLMSYTRSLEQRVPFLIGLDEAAYWLPQTFRGRTYLSKERFQDLLSAFHGLAIRGRKLGLVPLLFTQRFANLHKDMLSPGTYFLMRHTVDVDLRRYLEYINATAFGEDDLSIKQIMTRIAAFRPGQAVVKLRNGEQRLVQFRNRQSEHISHAPRTAAAVSLYHDLPFDPNRRYGPFTLEVQLPVELEEEPTHA